MSNTYIALLRGINIGAHNRIKMVDLRNLLESIGLDGAQTYHQSGNVLFESGQNDKGELADKISGAIKKSHGFKPEVILLTLPEMRRAVEANPFPQDEETDPKSMHFGFLASEAEQPDLSKLKKLKKDNEAFELKDTVFYLHAPDGIGRSDLAAASERALGVTITDRNLKTVQKIIEMAEEE